MMAMSTRRWHVDCYQAVYCYGYLSLSFSVTMLISKHRRTGQHPFGGSNPVLPEWSRTNILSFARINVIPARIGGVNCPPPPDPPSRTPMSASVLGTPRVPLYVTSYVMNGPEKSGHVFYGAILFHRLLMHCRQNYGILCL